MRSEKRKPYLGPRQCRKCLEWFTPDLAGQMVCRRKHDTDYECGATEAPKATEPVDLTCEVCTVLWKGQPRQTQCDVCRPQKFKRVPCRKCGTPFWKPSTYEGKDWAKKCLECRQRVHPVANAPKRAGRLATDVAKHRVQSDFYLYKYEDNTDFIRLLEEERGWHEEL